MIEKRSVVQQCRRKSTSPQGNMWNLRGFSSLAEIVVAVLCCVLVASCGQDDDGLAPGPLPPPASLSDLLGSVLHDANGVEVGIETIEETDVIAIYFAAGWCPVCADFTPQLVDFYQEVELAGKSFEVVFVSFDHSAEDMFAYMTDAEMPWIAVPYGSDKDAALKIRYDVRVIPTVVVTDNQGSTISLDGRADIVARGVAAYDYWLGLNGG